MDTPSTPPPPPPPPPPAPPPPPPPPAPAPKKSNTLVIVLCVILGLFVLGLASCIGLCSYGAYKAKKFSQESQKNPTYAALNMTISAATLGGEIEVLSRDPDKGIITVKNKKTGEVVRIDSSDYTAENISAALEKATRSTGSTSSNTSRPARQAEVKQEEQTPAETETATAEPEPTPSPVPEKKVSNAKANAMATVLKKFPSHIPTYPGGKTTDATLTNLGGATIGNYEFTTSDEPEKVVEYYEKKATSAGYAVQMRGNDANDNGPTATIAATKDQEMVSVNAESTSNGVKVSITFTRKAGN